MAKDMHRRMIAGESVQFEMQGAAQGWHAARHRDARGADPLPRPAARPRHGARHHRAEARRGRARAPRRAAAAVEEARGDRHPGRRHRARLQQHPRRDPRLRRDGAEERRRRARRCGATSTRWSPPAMRAKSLVERILAFSRSGVGERVPVHVQSVVAEALDLLAASLPPHVRLERRLGRRRRRGDGRRDADPPGGDEPVRQRARRR